jgi:hypothetical protein
LEIHLDRQIVYPGAVPLETDLLNTNKAVHFALGQLCQDAFGQGATGPFFTGLACVPNTPAAMNVIVQPGAVYAQAALDTTAYSSLAADSTVTMKQGILKSSQTFATPAPTTSGQSIVYLISASFLEADTNAVVLPYYNASNPSQAYIGPNGTGSSQNTTRQDTVALTLTTGVPATTGSQLTPATPNGQTALYTITVAYGATSVTAANIKKVSGAPFFPGFTQGNFSNYAVVASSQAYSALSLGRAVAVNSGSATTQTLPVASTCYSGAAILFSSASTGTVTITAQGGDSLFVGGRAGSANVSLNNGDWAWIVCDGSSSWTVVLGSVQLGYSASFGASFGGSGYQKLPSGLVIQWGAFVGSSSGDTPVTFPIAFPNSFRLAVVSGLCSGTGAWGGYNSATVNGMNCNWWSAASTRQSGSGTYIAIGN